MHSLRFLLSSSLAMLIGFWVALSCGAPHDAPCEGYCECVDNSCVCPDEEGCAIDCEGGDCDLHCSGNGDCDFACDENCDIQCTGNGPCTIDVGHASSVTCSGNGICDVACHGDCNVVCSSGTCIMRCLAEIEGAICELAPCWRDITECPDHPDHVRVCNGGCPPHDR
jgi:hypothetical protein